MQLVVYAAPVVAVGALAFFVQEDVGIVFAQFSADRIHALHIHCQNGSQRKLAFLYFQAFGAGGGEEFTGIFRFAVKFAAAGQIFLYCHIVRYAVFAFDYAQNI